MTQHNIKKNIGYCIGGFIKGMILFFCVLQMPLTVHADENKTGDGQVPAVHNEDYTIGAGDILDIMVWKNEELTKKLQVRPDGKISLPLLGEIMVEGKKVKELSDQLREMYSKYMSDPIIYVSVQQVNSMNVYIIGRVNAPGVKPITAKTNVLQGLAMASGLTPFAEGDRIKIFRTEDDGTTSLIAFDYEDVSRGRKLHQNIFLKRGDVIVVP